MFLLIMLKGNLNPYEYSYFLHCVTLKSLIHTKKILRGCTHDTSSDPVILVSTRSEDNVSKTTQDYNNGHYRSIPLFTSSEVYYSRVDISVEVRNSERSTSVSIKLRLCSVGS